MNQPLAMLLFNTSKATRSLTTRNAASSSNAQSIKTDEFSNHFSQALKSSSQTLRQRTAGSANEVRKDDPETPSARSADQRDEKSEIKQSEDLAAENRAAVVMADDVMKESVETNDDHEDSVIAADNPSSNPLSNPLVNPMAPTAAAQPRNPGGTVGELMRLARQGSGARGLLSVSAPLGGQAAQDMAREVADETRAAAVQTPWWSLGRDLSVFGGVMQENLQAAMTMPVAAASVASVTPVNHEMLEATIMADVVSGKSTHGQGHQAASLLNIESIDLPSGHDSTTLTDINLSGKSGKSGHDTPVVQKSVSPYTPQFGDELVDQVGRMRVISRPGMPEQVTMRLDPEELGSLQVRVQVDQDRQVQVSIIAESEATRDIINRQMPQLKEALARSNLLFGEVMVQVDHGDGQASHYNSNSAGHSDDSRWGQPVVVAPESLSRQDGITEPSLVRPTRVGSGEGLSILV
ncbi:MAG: flagellar hook-length control protein FliK [Magnetococcales bacterium]|nr:flagellar hook-length control protein FliK [Magnetococcales bacterium]